MDTSTISGNVCEALTEYCSNTVQAVQVHIGKECTSMLQVQYSTYNKWGTVQYIHISSLLW
jgi:hypothetical protein